MFEDGIMARFKLYEQQGDDDEHTSRSVAMKAERLAEHNLLRGVFHVSSRTYSD